MLQVSTSLTKKGSSEWKPDDLLRNAEHWRHKLTKIVGGNRKVRQESCQKQFFSVTRHIWWHAINKLDLVYIVMIWQKKITTFEISSHAKTQAHKHCTAEEYQSNEILHKTDSSHTKGASAEKNADFNTHSRAGTTSNANLEPVHKRSEDAIMVSEYHIADWKKERKKW